MKKKAMTAEHVALYDDHCVVMELLVEELLGRSKDAMRAYLERAEKRLSPEALADLKATLIQRHRER